MTFSGNTVQTSTKGKWRLFFVVEFLRHKPVQTGILVFYGKQDNKKKSENQGERVRAVVVQISNTMQFSSGIF